MGDINPLFQGVKFGSEFKPNPVEKLYVIAVDAGKTNGNWEPKIEFGVFGQVVILPKFSAYFMASFWEIAAILILGAGTFP